MEPRSRNCWARLAQIRVVDRVSAGGCVPVGLRGPPPVAAVAVGIVETFRRAVDDGDVTLVAMPGFRFATLSTTECVGVGLAPGCERDLLIPMVSTTVGLVGGRLRSLIAARLLVEPSFGQRVAICSEDLIRIVSAPKDFL